MNNKTRPLLAFMLLAMSATTMAAQYQFVIPINGISASPTDRIKSFLLDKTTFSEYEPVGVAWDVAAKPDWVSITEIGKVTANGQQTTVFGDINEVTLTASFRGVEESETIPVQIAQEITDFSLDKTIFGEYEPVNLNWRISGKPDNISISGIGDVPKTGSKSAYLGSVNEVTLTASFNGVNKSRTISTTTTPAISSFSLDMTSFDIYQYIKATWTTNGSPKVTITGFGNVNANGNLSKVLGDPGNQVTLTATYPSGLVFTKSIDVTIIPTTWFNFSKAKGTVAGGITSWDKWKGVLKVNFTGFGVGDAQLPGSTVGLTEIGWYNHTDTPSLTNLNHLSGVTVANIIDVRKDGITNIDGLGSLSRMDSNLNLSDNKITSLYGLRSLITASSSLNLTGNLLTSLDGLENLRTAKYLYFTSNPALTNISALGGITATGVELRLDNKTYPVRISNSSLFCQRIRTGANKLYLNNTPVTDTASYNKICG